jgi:hypothetical protein
MNARLRLAIRLWHRFGNPNVESFDDETHKAEYLDAIDGLSSCLLVRLLIGRALRPCLRGESPKALAIEFGTSESLPREIAKGRSWKDALLAAREIVGRSR